MNELESAKKFWESIKSKSKQTINELTQNCMKIEKYEVSVVANTSTGKIGVKQPFGTTINVDYDNSALFCQVGDSVFVQWWGTMSTAKAYCFSPRTATFTAPTPYSNRCTVTTGGYVKIGKKVDVDMTITISSDIAYTNTYIWLLTGLPVPKNNYAAIPVCKTNIDNQGRGVYDGCIGQSGEFAIHFADYGLTANNVLAITGSYWTN